MEWDAVNSERLGIRAFRSNVAAAVRRAAVGERIVITVDGKPVAQLGPVGERAGSTVTLDDLAATGLVEPPHRTLRHGHELVVEDLAVDVRLDRVLDALRGG